MTRPVVLFRVAAEPLPTQALCWIGLVASVPGASVGCKQSLQQHLTWQLHREAGCLCFVLIVGASVGSMLPESADQVGSSSAATQHIDLLVELPLLQMAVLGS